MSDDAVNFPDRQTPVGDEVFFDHVAWMTADMDGASAAFERLGFVLTPYSEHGNRDPETGERQVQGSANRLAMLERGYIEILCAVPGADTPVSRNIADNLARYEGVHLVACTVSDADADYARLQRQGTPLYPMVHLRRDVEAADGSDAEVAFSVVRPEFGAFPEGRMQVLTHHTPDHMWQDRYIARENGLTGLAQVLFCVEDPAASAARLSALTRTPWRTDGEDAVIDLTRGRMRFTTEAGLDRLIPGAVAPSLPFVAALGFRSRDVAASRAFFADRGVTMMGRSDGADGGFAIGAQDGLGCYLMISD